MTVKSKLVLGDLFPVLGLLESEAFLAEHSSLRIGAASDLLFIAQESYLKGLESSKALVIFVSDSLYAAVPEHLKSRRIVLRVQDAMLAMAKASPFFSTELCPLPGVHSSAVVHTSVKLGEKISIGPGVVVEEGAEIGDGSILHARVTVGPRVKIGRDCVFFPGVVLYQDTIIGDRVRVHANSVIGSDGFGYVQERTPKGVKHIKIHHLGAVQIGNDVEIGASTTVDRGTVGNTRIGDGVILDNQVQIGHNCQLEEGVIVCGSTGIAGSVKIGKYALVAGFVGIGNGAEIGAGAQIAGYTMVFGKVPAGVKWGGVPGRLLRDNMRLQAMLTRLPEIYEDWKKRKKEK